MTHTYFINELMPAARRLTCTLGIFLSFFHIYSQDTVVFQTLTWDSAARDYVFSFPDDPAETYEKIIMLYNMRCKNAVVSTGGAPNAGCGEWDYSCNTYITDSSKTDSLMATAPNYVISGFSGTNYDYSVSPTYSYYQTEQTEIIYTGTVSETVGIIGSGSATGTLPFDLTTGMARVQYLINESELTSAGLGAGDITGLRLDLSSLGSAVNNLRINLKGTTKANLHPDTLELEGFTNVYYLNTSFVGTGQHQFNFHSGYTWDGVSNLIVELTFDQSSGTNTEVTTDNYGASGVGLVSAEADYCLEFNGAQMVNLATPMPTISNELTISFWCYGDTSVMPSN